MNSSSQALRAANTASHHQNNGGYGGEAPASAKHLVYSATGSVHKDNASSIAS